MSEMNTETKVGVELEREHLENAITSLHEAAAGVTAVNADAIVLEAELMTIRDILIATGLCTGQMYQGQFGDNVSNALADLAESGMIDINAVVDADDGVVDD